jgi:hypothetical protein
VHSIKGRRKKNKVRLHPQLRLMLGKEKREGKKERMNERKNERKNE